MHYAENSEFRFSRLIAIGFPVHSQAAGRQNRNITSIILTFSPVMYSFSDNFFRTFPLYSGTRFNFFYGGGVAGLEDFACTTLPTIPLDFQGNVKNFCHPTLRKIRLKISVTPPFPFLEKGQRQNYGASTNSNGLLTLSGLLGLKFLLHMTNLFHQEEPF